MDKNDNLKEDQTREENADEKTTEKQELSPLEEENEELKADLAKKEDQVLRLSAEIQNMNRRQAKDRQDREKYRSQALATALLDSLDNLERALQIDSTDEASENLKKGIEMVHESVLEAMKREGIEVINPVGEKFDPNLHQSVSAVDKNEQYEPEEVVEVFQKGYRLKDRVLRPAMVIIAQ